MVWTKDNKPLIIREPDANRILVEEANNGRIQRLVFQDVLETDLGNYDIQAESISCSSYLDMKGMLRFRLVIPLKVNKIGIL